MNLASDHTIVTRHVELDVPPGDAHMTGGVLHAVSSRSDAVRLAMVVAALRTRGIPQALARLTGPRTRGVDVFDRNGLPRTEALVEAGPWTDLERTAQALAAAERTLLERAPATLVRGGDGDGALAFALAASKLEIPIVRLGGGLRCGDFSQPEEVNRVLADRLADVLFTDSRELGDELECEGIDRARVRHVGNTAIDLLRRFEPEARRAAAWRRFGLTPDSYVLATLHRPENTGDDLRVTRIVQALAELAKRRSIVMPLHPATRACLERSGGLAQLEGSGVRVTEPLGYLDFISLEQSAGAILTDAGLVQDEASALGVRCYTLRRATERIATLTHGTNILLGDDPAEIAEVRIDMSERVPSAIPLWDGRASERVAAELASRLRLELAC
jgi:UDP-N-acetylglucosamine 2-epimerase (non-hydrolysing)